MVEAFNSFDILMQAMAEMDDELKEDVDAECGSLKEEDETCASCTSCDSRKRRRDEQEKESPRHDADFDDFGVSYGFLDDEINTGEESVQNAPKLNSRDLQDDKFEFFLKNIDQKVESIKSLRPETYRCSKCDEKAILFCKNCITFSCESCHKTCDGANHNIAVFNSTMIIDKVTARRSVLRLPSTFNSCPSSVCMHTHESICHCEEGDERPKTSAPFLLLQDDRRLSTASIAYCRNCCSQFRALWSHGFLDLGIGFVVEISFCEFLQDMVLFSCC